MTDIPNLLEDVTRKKDVEPDEIKQVEDSALKKFSGETASEKSHLTFGIVTFFSLMLACSTLFCSHNPENLMTPFEKAKASLIKNATVEKQKLDDALKTVNAFKDFQDKPLILRMRNYAWIPDPSRFKGVDELVKQFSYNGTDIENFLYFGRPYLDFTFGLNFSMPAPFSPINFKSLVIANCFLDSDCYDFKDATREGYFHLQETFKSEYQEFTITRVYYVSIDNFM